MRLNYEARIDVMAALVAETTLGVGSQVRDRNNRLWKRMTRGDWMAPGGATLPSLVDVVQRTGAVTVVRILGSELQ